MLTPSQLEAVSNDISRIYEKTETACIEAIVRRLSQNKNITSMTAWQLKKLNDAGMLRKELISVISQQSKKSLSEVKALVEQSIRKAYAYDMAKAKNITYQNAWEQAIKSQVFKSAVKKATTGVINILNVTNTKALASSLELYRNCVNEMFYKVTTGIYDFDKAYKQAVQTVGTYGVRITSKKEITVNEDNPAFASGNGNLYNRYDSGVVYPVDSAIRRDIITTFNQTAIEETLAYCNEMGIDLVITSQHYGARPEHEVWQGQVFSLTGNGYPDFYSSTGYGEVVGLGGINCRHSISPYTEGDPVPEKLDKATNDKIYKEQTQQRSYESRLRTLKRQQIAFRTAGDRHNAELVQAKINHTSANYKQFLNDTGRRRETMLDSITGYHPIRIKGTN